MYTSYVTVWRRSVGSLILYSFLCKRDHYCMAILSKQTYDVRDPTYSPYLSHRLLGLVGKRVK